MIMFGASSISVSGNGFVSGRESRDRCYCKTINVRFVSIETHNTKESSSEVGLHRSRNKSVESVLNVYYLRESVCRGKGQKYMAFKNAHGCLMASGALHSIGREPCRTKIKYYYNLG